MADRKVNRDEILEKQGIPLARHFLPTTGEVIDRCPIVLGITKGG